MFCLDVGDHVLWFSQFFQGKGSRCWSQAAEGMGFSLGSACRAVGLS